MRKALAKRGLASLRPEEVPGFPGAAPPTPAHQRSEKHALSSFLRGFIEAQRCAALQLLSFTSEVIEERRSAVPVTPPLSSAVARPWQARFPALSYGALELLALSVEDQVTVLSIYTEWKVEVLSHAAVAARAQLQEIAPTILPRGDELTVGSVRRALQTLLEALSRAEVDPALVNTEMPLVVASMSLALREWVQERLKALQVDEEALLPWLVRHFKHLDGMQRLASSLVFGSLRPLRTIAEALLWALDNQPNARGRVRFKASLAGCLGFEAAAEVLSLAERNRATAAGGYRHPTIAAAAASAPVVGGEAPAPPSTRGQYGTLHEDVTGPEAPSAYVPLDVGGAGTHLRRPTGSEGGGAGFPPPATAASAERGRAPPPSFLPTPGGAAPSRSSPMVHHHVRAVSEVSRSDSSMPSSVLAPVMQDVTAVEGVASRGIGGYAPNGGGGGGGGGRLQYFPAASSGESGEGSGGGGTGGEAVEDSNYGEESIYEDRGPPCEEVCAVAMTGATALGASLRPHMGQPQEGGYQHVAMSMRGATSQVPTNGSARGDAESVASSLPPESPPLTGLSAQPYAPMPHSPRLGVPLRSGGPLQTGYSPGLPLPAPVTAGAARGGTPVLHRLSLAPPPSAVRLPGSQFGEGDGEEALAAASKTWAGRTPKLSALERLGAPPPVLGGGGAGGGLPPVVVLGGPGSLALLASEEGSEGWGGAPTAPAGRATGYYRRRALPDSFLAAPGGLPPPPPSALSPPAPAQVTLKATPEAGLSTSTTVAAAAVVAALAATAPLQAAGEGTSQAGEDGGRSKAVQEGGKEGDVASSGLATLRPTGSSMRVRQTGIATEAAASAAAAAAAPAPPAAPRSLRLTRW